MNRLKQGLAAVMLVTSLGLVMPSAFGGSVSADPKPGQGTADETPRWLYCDLNGDNTYESPYEVISQSRGPEAGFHDLHSSTVLVYLADQTIERFVPFVDPDHPDDPFDEREFVDITYDIRGGKGGKRIGQEGKVVACHEGLDEFRYVTDITACCDPLIEDAHYHVWESRTWYVTFSGNGQGAAQVASADDVGTQAAQPQLSKHKSGGKHRAKGKHRK